MGKSVEQLKQEATAKDGLRRLGTAEDVAALASFLCSEKGAPHPGRRHCGSMAAPLWAIIDVAAAIGHSKDPILDSLCGMPAFSLSRVCGIVGVKPGGRRFLLSRWQ